ncbi:putative peptide zinc metalloprotease protein [Flavobacterium resistens]|uniref:Peptidase, M50 family protein n=1 Tax=Flavobacterium resistens TaxID=443612 RepID=A0A521F1I4_9FLAO|nr:peptidase, M50 family protein [Flavobacterium resistens]MRX69333.1 peptidase, M50 family protein [Flavobacterium resistens]SMO89310.1 putative peptide zinc metalloprotease protein [Flavobacterium resistens]
MEPNLIPKLSKDITFNPINKNDFFIHQTVYDHRIKISQDLYSFLQLIDNHKSLDVIILEYNEKYNSTITKDFANDFLYQKLAKFGIIESNVEIKPDLKPAYLRLSFIVINEKTVSKLTQYLKFLFLPKALITILFLSLLTLISSFYFFSDQILHSSMAKSEWLFLFILSFIGVTFHEFGHASAAHYYGAKHGGIGGGFYLFMPVYFADVTDIWKLPKKERIIVNMAGMYFEIVYVVFLIAIGAFFNFQTLIILACIFSISILHSLNPFARSDGYWILSDALEKPNLMFHGFLRIKLIFTPKTKWRKMDYFLLLYGLISVSFIFFFLYFVLIKNPDSILYFPRNSKNFITNLFSKNARFSLDEVGKLFIPLLFFYLVFGLLKKMISKKT